MNDAGARWDSGVEMPANIISVREICLKQADFLWDYVFIAAAYVELEIGKRALWSRFMLIV